jgi:hypothetical protein
MLDIGVQSAALRHSSFSKSAFAPILVAALLLAHRPAQAEPRRYALLIGANAGERDEVVLRYANDDAHRLSRILQQLGGFRGEDVVLLQEAGANDVRSALIDLNERVRHEPHALLFVYYSGHADADTLHLSGSRLPFRELRGLVSGSSATTRVLVVDACRSGAITRVKGGHAGPSFDVRVETPVPAEGMAILTSSAAGEDSQESDSLGGSIFTHYLASALVGAADADKDGQITIGEAFSYASSATLAATAATVAGPQHPTFRLDLAGREDLVLTRPALLGRQVGGLAFQKPGHYLVWRGRVAVAELDSDEAGHRLALEVGRYHVVRRGVDHLLEGDFVVAAGQVGEVDADRLRRVDYARVVRKGGTGRRRSFALNALAGLRLGRELSGAYLAGLGGRWDLPQLSVELRLTLGLSSNHSGQTDGALRDVDIHTYDLTPMVLVLRAFDVGRVTFGLGLDIGGAFVLQKIDITRTGYAIHTSDDHRAFGVVVGALGQLQVALGRGFYYETEISLQTYWLRFPESGFPHTGGTELIGDPSLCALGGFGANF